jgi:hypothetical protein
VSSHTGNAMHTAIQMSVTVTSVGEAARFIPMRPVHGSRRYI